MFDRLRECYNLYFIYLKANNMKDTTIICENSMIENKVCFNPYKGIVYMSIKLKKNHYTDRLYNQYNDNKLYSLKMLFYNDNTNKNNTITFIKVLEFDNDNQYYNIKIELNKKWSKEFVDGYRIYEIVNN